MRIVGRTPGAWLRSAATACGSRAFALALVSLGFATESARAVDGTWLTAPATADWNTGTNWSSAPAVPDGTASFGASTQTSLTFSASTTSIDAVQFNAGAPAYTFTLGSTQTFNVNGTGVTNQSSNVSTFNNAGNVNFNNSSSAGDLTYNNNATNGTFTFNNSSSAGTAQINESSGSPLIIFGDSSTAANAHLTIVAGPSAGVGFLNSSSAGNAVITNAGLTEFDGSATATDPTIRTPTAANAIITNNSGGTLSFGAFTETFPGGIPTFNPFIGTGSAGNATIVNNNGGKTQFFNQSTASTATITNNAGGSLLFANAGGSAVDPDASTARVINNAGGTVDISQVNAGVSIGSVEGAGQILLGSKTLTLGHTNLSTTISGVIADGGAGGGTGGALVKAGSGTLTLTAGNTYTGGTTISGGTLTAGNNEAFGSGTVSMAAGTTLSFLNIANFTVANNFKIAGDPNFAPPAGTTQTLSGVIANGASPGVLNMQGPGTLVLTAANTYSGGTKIAGGTLQIGNGGTSGSITGNVVDKGTLAFDRSDTIAFPGAISGTGALQQNGGIASNVILTATNKYSGGTVINSGGLQIGNGGTSGSITGNVAINGGVVSELVFDRSDNVTFGGLISGTGSLQQIGSGTLILPNANIFSGGTFILSGTVAVGNDFSLGSGFVGLVHGAKLAFTQNGLNIPNAIFLGVAAGTIDTGANTETLSGVISGADDLTKIGSGTLILTAINTYSGPTNIDAGTLDVTGSIAKSSLTTVGKGAALTGSGTIGAVQINAGGMLAPGNGTPGTSLVIAGSLAFASGAAYLVQVNPATATDAKVKGAATLTGATVTAQFANGAYVQKQYTILQAGGLNGTFAGLSNSNLPAGFSDSLSYAGGDVFLNLNPGLPFGGLTVNERNVAVALNSFFNNGGALPPSFAGLFGLTDGGLANALMHLDGEVSTGAELASFQLMSEFLQLMLDPFVDGRFGSGAGFGGGPAMSFAPDTQTILPPDVALAYAGVLKAPPAPPFQQRWTVWGASYGGANTTSGDPAVIGSSNLSAQTFGFAAGMDYHYSPDTVVGFALGGGGTEWGLAGGMGTGRSDAFQTGVYGITRSGPAYLGATFAFANHWMTTNRSTMGDALTANFDAQSYGVRAETGYRLAPLPPFGVTPYAAVQAQAFRTPNYAETDLTGGGLGLAYAAANATDTRTELGTRFDDPAVVASVPILLRARVAWAHDFVSNPALSAAFESLPGTNFVVNGAPIPQNSALTSAGAEVFITPRVTLLAKFDGEFARGSQTYAGSGTLRYVW
jgi:autotransporter-associated beta strand protein